MPYLGLFCKPFAPARRWSNNRGSQTTPEYSWRPGETVPASGHRHARGGNSFVVRKIIKLSTHRREELVDITQPLNSAVAETGVSDGLVALYAQGATAAIMIQENWDESVQTDVVHLLQRLIPRGVWLHDKQDGNGDAHLKAGLVGPSESIPLIGGQLGLSRWQNVFFCEFDGPRAERTVVCTVIPVPTAGRA